LQKNKQGDPILRINKSFKKGSITSFLAVFYVVKLASDVIAYFISLYPIERTQLIVLYRIRWNIELYHRIA